jgi:SAM-dependent methyltransferase
MVSAHDWLQEVGPQHVHDVLEALRLMPFREEAWSEDGLRMATWEVPDRGQQPSSSLEASTTWRKGDDVSWHRETVGGNWDFMGEAQLRILESYGLRPHSLLLDVGCGSLRLGVKAIAFLEAGGYFGVDCHKELLDVGIKRELEPSEALRAKGPMFAINSNFDLSAFGETTFDMAIAQSVFTHLPPQDIELCLRSVMSRLGPDGVFLASYNAAVGGWAAFGQPYPEMTRYSPEMFASIASRLGIRVENVGQWGIPQNSRNEQLLLAFRHR